MKPRSEACERNRDPILKVLMQWFLEPGTALEIGSGTGQHAVYFARHMPHITWLSSDLEDNRPGISCPTCRRRCGWMSVTWLGPWNVRSTCSVPIPPIL
jgi:hypothetical protein